MDFSSVALSSITDEKEWDVMETKQSAIVVVHGESGLGKTSLIDSLRQPVIAHHGYFCAGKYFQNTDVQEPYSAITAAFSDLCDLIAQSDDFDESRRKEIQQALGSDGDLLTSFISNISPFVTKSKDSIDVVVKSSVSNKFKAAFKTFLHAMSSAKHPIVLFLDDVQWMDAGSRQLIDILLHDKQLTSVMVVFAYREEEAKLAAPIFENFGVDFIDIRLHGLSSFDVHQIVPLLLGGTTTVDDVRELSQIVVKRALGNPFHIIQFLQSIQVEGLLSFNADDERWEYDVDEIQTEIMLADTVVDLLFRRIDRLGDTVKEALKVASVIGYRFSQDILLEVQILARTSTLDVSLAGRNEAHLILKEAIDIGFIEKTKHGFHFTHDKLQTAFQSMVADAQEETELHKLIGEAFLIHTTGEFAIYNAAVHLNLAIEFIKTDEDLLRLLQINLDAANYCTTRSAFTAASQLLSEALEFTTPEQRWSSAYFNLSFEMTELFAKTELIIGNFETCSEANRETLRRAKSIDMKLSSLLRAVEVRMVTHDMDEILICARKSLSILGIELPEKVRTRHVIWKLFQIKKMIRDMNDQDILNLPMMTHQTIAAATKLLLDLFAFSFLRDEESLSSYSALLAMELTLKYGLSPYSPPAFLMYGLVVQSAGKHDVAYRFGELALKMLDATQSNETLCPTVGIGLSVLRFRRKPMDDLRQQLFEAGKIGMETGDIVYGSYCYAASFSMSAIIGRNLQELEESMEFHSAKILELGQDSMLNWIKPTHQMVQNLQSYPGTWSALATMTGEVMNENQFVADATKKNNRTLIVMLLIVKSVTSSSLRFFDDACKWCEEACSIGRVVKVVYGRIPLFWGASFSHFELYRTSGKRKHLRKGRLYQKELKEMAAQGSPEADRYLEFCNAVEFSVLNKKADIATLTERYDKAIAGFAAGSIINIEGILNEQVGFDLFGRGFTREAKPYFERAMDLFLNGWGATAKCAWLEEEMSVMYPDRNEKEQLPATQLGTLLLCGGSGEEHY